MGKQCSTELSGAWNKRIPAQVHGIQKNKEDHFLSHTWMDKGRGCTGHSGLATNGFSDNSETCSNLFLE